MLGKFKLLKEIGRGGMGIVFKAREMETGRVVALKMILVNHLASAEHLRRFKAEMNAAAQLVHRHIVPLYETGEWNGLPYFSMQYVEGTNLALKLMEGTLSSAEASEILARIAGAVSYLHQKGIVHRDLKPGNILLDGQGRPYVTDFGLAKVLVGERAQTTMGVIMGTPSYMSPEQASGRSNQVGPASDIYSLGAIFYEALTGRPPFLGESKLETILQVLEGEPKPPRQIDKTIPVDLEIICLRCLEKNPQRRFPSASELERELERFNKGEAIESRQHGLMYKVKRWARRESALVARLGALAICAVIVQVNYWVSGSVTFLGHEHTLVILATWAGVSFLFQQLLIWQYRPSLVRLCWSGMDIILLTLLIWRNEDLANPIVICYPLLVAGSSLWVEVRLTWFTTLFSVLGYIILIGDATLRNQMKQPIHHHIIFLIILVILGYIVSYQVQRIRALNRYLEHQK